MKQIKQSIILILSFFCLLLAGHCQETQQIQLGIVKTDSGSLKDYIKLNLLEHAPGENSGIYQSAANNPAIITAFSQSIDAAFAHQLQNAADSVIPYQYEYISFYDEEAAQTVYILKEQEPITRGWGWYIIQPDAQSSYYIQIPHPIYEYKVYALGVDCMFEWDSPMLFLSNTHRFAQKKSDCYDAIDPPNCYLSDPTRNPDHLFHLVHRTLVPNDAVVAQIHGFTQQSGDPDIILSCGKQLSEKPVSETHQLPYIYHYPPDPNTQDLFHAISEEAFSIRIYEHSSYINYDATVFIDRLSGGPNIQGKDIRERGGWFIHLELSKALRSDETAYSQLFITIELFLDQAFPVMY